MRMPRRARRETPGKSPLRFFLRCEHNWQVSPDKETCYLHEPTKCWCLAMRVMLELGWFLVRTSAPCYRYGEEMTHGLLQPLY